MSFTPGMADSDGKFAAPKYSDEACRKCSARTVFEEEWDSPCGGWTDWKYTCHTCGHKWWVEGIDS